MTERYKGWDAHDLRDHLLHTEMELRMTRMALRIYGGHIPPCKGMPCDCGFRAAWEKASEPQTGSNDE